MTVYICICVYVCTKFSCAACSNHNAATTTYGLWVRGPESETLTLAAIIEFYLDSLSASLRELLLCMYWCVFMSCAFACVCACVWAHDGMSSHKKVQLAMTTRWKITHTHTHTKSHAHTHMSYLKLRFGTRLAKFARFSSLLFSLCCWLDFYAHRALTHTHNRMYTRLLIAIAIRANVCVYVVAENIVEIVRGFFHFIVCYSHLFSCELSQQHCYSCYIVVSFIFIAPHMTLILFFHSRD